MADKDKEKVREEEEERLWKKIEEAIQDEEEFKQFKGKCRAEKVLASDVSGYEEKDLIELGLSKKGLRERLLKYLGRLVLNFF